METLLATIPKESISSLPRYVFDGPIEVVDTFAACAQAVATLSRSKILGLDTETRPTFRRGERHRVALLQLANDERCYLFRLNKIGLPDNLVQLFTSPDIQIIGLSLGDDWRALQWRKKFTPVSFIDLQTAAREMGIHDMSLQKLFANFFGQRISKSKQLSNWEANSLTPEQQAYAATDAYACLLLYKKIAELKENNLFRVIDNTPPVEPKTLL